MVVDAVINAPSSVTDVQNWADNSSYGYAYKLANNIIWTEGFGDSLHTYALSDSVEGLQFVRLIRLQGNPPRPGLVAIVQGPSHDAPDNMPGVDWYYNWYAVLIDLQTGEAVGSQAVGHWWEWYGDYYEYLQLDDVVVWPPPPAVTRWIVFGATEAWVYDLMSGHAWWWRSSRILHIAPSGLESTFGAYGSYPHPFANPDTLRIVAGGVDGESCWGPYPPCEDNFTGYISTTEGGREILCESLFSCPSYSAWPVDLWQDARLVVTPAGGLYDATSFETRWQEQFDVGPDDIFTARVDESFSDRIFLATSTPGVWSVYSALPFAFLGNTTPLSGFVKYILRSSAHLDRIVTRSGSQYTVWRPADDPPIPQQPARVTLRPIPNSNLLHLTWTGGSPSACAYRVYGSFTFDGNPTLIAEVPATSLSYVVPASSERSFFWVRAVYP